MPGKIRQEENRENGQKSLLSENVLLSGSIDKTNKASQYNRALQMAMNAVEEIKNGIIRGLWFKEKVR